MPPKTNSDDLVNGFYSLTRALFNENRKAYICGDFNTWVEDDTYNYKKIFLEVIGNFNYKNVVYELTSRSGHMHDK